MNDEEQYSESSESPTSERELDFLVAHELASGSGAARLLWQGFDPKPDEPPKITREKSRYDTRTTDVEAETADPFEF